MKSIIGVEATLAELKNSKNFFKFRSENIKLTRQQVREAIDSAWIVTHVTNNLDELDSMANTLSSRLREWYSLTLPELAQKLHDNVSFANKVLQDRASLVKEYKISDSMGVVLKSEDINEMRSLAKKIIGLYALREDHVSYLDNLLEVYARNLKVLLGTTLTAKMITQAGSLKRLAFLPSSTVQLLGAEKALFRHLTTGAKAPKHGIIHQHQLLQKSKNKGKAARALAEKISFCARLDYFKGDFKADKYLKELEEKLNE